MLKKWYPFSNLEGVNPTIIRKTYPCDRSFLLFVGIWVRNSEEGGSTTSESEMEVSRSPKAMSAVNGTK